MTAALVAFVLPLVEGPAKDWPWWSVGRPCRLGCALRRAGAHSGGSRRAVGFAVGLVNVVAFNPTVATWFFVLAIYLQDGRHLSALGAGLRVLALLTLWAVIHAYRTGGSLAWVALPLAVDGAGQGPLAGPLISSVLLGVPRAVAGAGPGVVASAQQVGNSVGVAVIGAVFSEIWHGGASIADAFGAGLLVLAGAGIASVGLVGLLPNSPAREE